LSAAPAVPERDPRDYTPKHLADKILQSKSALEGERKQVTVLFADIVDSVPLAERTDPEEMHALLDRCFQLILPEVHRFEGTVNQFQGDGFMALFGAPLALEDAPRRACLAALAIQRVLEPLRREVRERHCAEFRWRIGIHSGPVVVGRIGDDLRMDYTAVGDTTNLAARLEKAAAPGAILISDATRRAIEGLFELEDCGEIQLKGKAESTHAWRVLSERKRTRLEAEVERGLTPLCGRERELAALEGAFESAADGRGQIVFVAGEAGIGKSRLLLEFRRRLGDRPHSWFLGLCIPYGRAAFEPIVDGVRRWIGIEDGDDEATALARTDETIHGWGADLEWTLPFVRHLLSLPAGDDDVVRLDGMILRSETVKALHALFAAAAARQPLVFAIEDLHWIDPASEEFLAGLAKAVPASRLLLVLTHRPEYRHTFGDRSYHTRLAMQALSEREMGRMAGAVLVGGELPPELQRVLASKAEGNPLFIEEVTRSLLEGGVLRVHEGRVELTRELANVVIPDRIQGVLAARIDRLEDGPKQAIQIASVIGREFALRLLQRIVEAGGAVPGIVEELRALELIYETSTHPELAFMFKHALTHDVAYDSVLVSRRRALHGVIGSAIEELYRDRLAEHYERLAHHFERAEDWAKALDYHQRAAEKAMRTWANQEAASHCRQALAMAERLPGPPAAARLQYLEELLGQTCTSMSEFRQAGEALLRAADYASDPAGRARNLARAAHALTWAHDFADAHEALDQAHALAREHGAKAEESMALSFEDELLLVEGTVFDTSLSDPAVRLAEESGDGEALVLSLTGQSGRLERAGEFALAIDAAERATTLGRELRMGHTAAEAQWFKGIAECCLGRYGDGLATIQAALELCEQISDSAVIPRLMNTLGWCYAELDCHERALEYNAESVRLARLLVEKQMVATAPELFANGSINLAGNHVALGDLDKARRALAPIEEVLRTDHDPWMQWRYSLHLSNARARVALVSGDVQGALDLTAGELEGARRSGSRKIEARALELRGRALVAADLRDEATVELGLAARVANEIGYPPVGWRAPSLLAELARRNGDRRREENALALVREQVQRGAASLPDRELRRRLQALGDRLAQNPLEAYR
jgi:class 3 adenylate cyclase/tetratricopeptide (TPR) repeat protein